MERSSEVVEITVTIGLNADMGLFESSSVESDIRAASKFL